MKVCTGIIATLAIALTASTSLLKAETAPAASLGSAQDAGASAPAASPAHAGRRYHKRAKVEVFLGYSRFGAGSNLSSGTAGNRMVGLNGGSAAVEFNLSRYVGLVGDFGGYDTNKLEITGTGANQPRDVDAGGTAYSYMFGPRVHFGRDRIVSPFAQVLVGGVHATAVTVNGCSGTSCTPLPVQNTLAVAAGGGIDIWLTPHIALRAVQAEYMLTRFAAVPVGSNSNQNDLRLSSGLVFRFGGGMESLPLQLTCSVQPESVFPGDVVTVASTATNLRAKRRAAYVWTTNGGAVTGSGEQVQISTMGIAPGSYNVSGKLTQGNRLDQQASCTAAFTVRSQEPPSVSCSASPETVLAGETATITAHGVSPQNRPLTYSYSATSGTVTGANTTASLSTTGAGPGPITVTCNVVDDQGKSGSAETTVNINAPVAAAPAPASPQVANMCTLSFERDRKRPVRVDNEAKACLDDVALRLQREPSGRLVIEGTYSNDEKPKAAAERIRNARQYLTGEKGIDAQRIELRVGQNGGRTATTIFIPVGATYPADGSTLLGPVNPHE